MPNSAPAAKTSSQTRRPYQPETLISKASSPEKEIRQIRARDARGQRRLLEGHEAEGVVGDVEAGSHPRDDLARLRADHGDRRPLLGDRGAVDVQLGPLGLQPLLQPVQHAGSATGGGVHVVAVLGHAQRHAVVEHHAVGLAHDAVASRADRQLLVGVGVDPVEELARVGALDLDLAERRGVHHADAGAGGAALRATAASRSSPSCGKYHGRSHWPTISNSAPCSTCQPWIGGDPLGVEQLTRARVRRAPRTRPACTARGGC